MRRNKYKKQAPRSRSAAMVCPVSVSTADNEAGAKSATVVAFASIEGCGITASSVAAQEYASTDAARATASNAEGVAFVNTAGRRGSAGNAWRFTAHARTARRETGIAGSAETDALHLRARGKLSTMICQVEIRHNSTRSLLTYRQLSPPRTVVTLRSSAESCSAILRCPCMGCRKLRL